MIKINLNCNEKSGSSLKEYVRMPEVLYLLGILMLSLTAFSPVVDAGCSCSGGNWDPSAFLNSELGSEQPVQPGSTQDSANAGSSAAGTQKPMDRVDPSLMARSSSP